MSRAAALLLAAACLAPALLVPTAAHAADPALVLSATTYSTGETVEVTGGTAPIPACVPGALDLYVVRAGSAVLGQTLVDVAGGPRGIGFDGTGGLWGPVVLGRVHPAGYLAPGSYTVVMDACRNGVLDAVDAVFPDAFTVVDPSRAAGTYSLAGDFVPLVNPNGAWTYGWASNPANTCRYVGQLTPYTLHYIDDKGDYLWTASTSLSFNGTGVVQHGSNTTTLQPGALAMHPGGAGEHAVSRWTAPAPGAYRVDGVVTGLSGWNGAPYTTTDFEVVHGTGLLHSATFNLLGYGNADTFSVTVAMTAGDTLDFCVGDGCNGYGWDTTALDILITPVTAGVAEAPRARVLALAPLAGSRRGNVRLLASLASGSDVRLDVFDVAGRLVAALARGRWEAGEHVVTWDGRDACGAPAAAGLYFARLAAGADAASAKLVLAR